RRLARGRRRGRRARRPTPAGRGSRTGAGMRQRPPRAGGITRGGAAPCELAATLLVAGVDAAGRGPPARPVVVAAVVFDPARPRVNGLDDSKQLCAARREALYARIVERALSWHVVSIGADEIDRLNIHQATMLGMRQAVEG